MLVSRRGWFAAMAVSAALATATSVAAAPQNGTLKYAITRNGSNIGSHTIRFVRTDAGVTVEHRVRVLVKVLFVTAYRYDADRTETWKDDKLIAYKAHTDDNGSPIDVRAELADSGLQVHGAKGNLTVPADTILAGAGYNLLDRHPTQMIDDESGKLLKVSVASTGEETLTVGGRTIKCQRYRITGDVDATFWYGPDGAIVKHRLKARDGSMVDTTLE